jgi:thioesterase domain-containing protein
VLERSNSALANLTEDQVAALTRVMTRNVKVGLTHRPGRFDGDILYLSATVDRTETSPIPTDWSPYLTGRLNVHPVDCAHVDMLRREPLTVIGPLVADVINKDGA